MFKNSVCVTFWIKLKCFFLQEKQSKVTSRSGLRWRLIPSQEVQSTSTRENTGIVRKNPIGPAARLFSYSWCDTLGMFKIPKSNCDGRQENWENCDNEKKSIGLWIENWFLCEWGNEWASERVSELVSECEEVREEERESILSSTLFQKAIWCWHFFKL